MPKESNLEFRVGIFVLLALISLTFFVLSVGDFSLFDQGHTYRAVFGFANGLKKSAPVRIAGVEEGIVQQVKVFFDQNDRKTKVEVIFLLEEKAMVPLDSSIMINQLGLFGEKYLEILPGSNTRRFFLPGDTIIGKDPVIQEDISQKIVEVASKIEQGVDGINRIINDADNQHSLKMSLERLSHITEGINNIINDETNQASLKISLEKISLITDSLHNIIDYIETGQGTVGKLIFDNNLYDELQLFSTDIKSNPWKLLYRPKKTK